MTVSKIFPLLQLEIKTLNGSTKVVPFWFLQNQITKGDFEKGKYSLKSLHLHNSAKLAQS